MKYGSIISGIPGHDIEDVTLDNIRIVFQGGGTQEQAAINPAEQEKGYPDPGHMGEMPSYGFFIRHVKGIELRNIDIRYEKEDQRPPFVLIDVKDIDLRNLRAQHAPSVPVFRMKSVTDFSLQQSLQLPDKKIAKTEQIEF